MCQTRQVVGVIQTVITFFLIQKSDGMFDAEGVDVFSKRGSVHTMYGIDNLIL